MKAKMVTFKSINGDESIDRLFEGQELLASNGINIGDTGMWIGENARDVQVPSNQTDKVVKILNDNGFEVVKILNDIDMGEEEKEKKGDENMIELISKENTMENRSVMDKTPEEWAEWVTENGNMLRDLLEEVDDFIEDRIYDDDNEWVDTDLDELNGFVRHVLYNGWIKAHEEEKEEMMGE